MTVRFHGAEHEVLWVAAYADVEPGQELLHVDSYGLVALAVRGGRADRDLGLVAPTVVSFSGSKLDGDDGAGDGDDYEEGQDHESCRRAHW